MVDGLSSDGRRYSMIQEEEAEESDVVDLSIDSEKYMVGFVIGNIVGIRHYDARIHLNKMEFVGLVREPLNTYDSNAVKVVNMYGFQIGYIERGIAAVIAPMIDSCYITVEAIIPKTPGSRNPYSIACQIYIFARMEAIGKVRMLINEGGLTLIQGDQSDDHLFGKSALIVAAEEKSMDKIFSLVGKVESKNVQVVEVEPSKDVIVTDLFLHQKEALGWLIGRENGNDLPPFWEKMEDCQFINALTNVATSSRPAQLRGGIFADEMGLGKTLTLLSLIATNMSTTAAASCLLEQPEEAADQRCSQRSKKRKNIASTSGSYEYPKAISATTLVVCPPSVFSTWITQLEQHTVPGSLKLYLYHGERTQKVSELLKYHIVLTTYSILSIEYTSEDSPISRIEWFRVILDEAHLIKNFGAQQTKACIALQSDRRWVVTGTPIQNNPFDLFSLMAFLKFEPFSIKKYWHSFVQRPLDQGNASGMLRLQKLIRIIALRRTKDSQAERKSLVRLPSKTIEICYVELSSEERERYEKFETDARSVVRNYINSDTIMYNYSTVLLIILRLRQMCNDIALCPADIRSMIPVDTFEDASDRPELLKKLLAMIEDGEDFDCAICFNPPEKTIITSCTHIFCKTCIMKAMKMSNTPRCPLCRRSIGKTDIFLAPLPPPVEEESKILFANNSFDINALSSKVFTLLKILMRVREQNPATKSVVFSQFGKMLVLLEDPLRAAGFVVAKFDGTMNVKRRSKVIKDFGSNAPRAPTILLASLRAAGVGINLTAASRVYFMDPWWNPSVEEQAMDRVHRIGQQNEVKVVRLIVKGSIEEKILELQEKKKQLSTKAFTGKRKNSVQEEKRTRIEDLRTIIGL
ncbi:putative DNA repair helicase rad5,16 [Zostera marina]|uniref:Putative DNA repair helicase rad5,16 n=1 Tax=Zostera marina TaxID=29655 RepID=A0A0K9PXJ6_ZOSMR|nr:putative DNA repair helicase rad5,16 [Zostera marina]